MIDAQGRPVSGPHEASGTRVSPDGKSVAYVIGGQFLGPWELRLAPTDAGDGKTIYHSGQPGGLRPLAWSSDGKRLLCLAQALKPFPGGVDQMNDLVFVDMPGGTVSTFKKDVGPIPGQSFSGAISPDGRYVAFSNRSHARLFSIDGTEDIPVAVPGTTDTRVFGWLPGTRDLIIGAGGRGPASYGIYRLRAGEDQNLKAELLMGQLETLDSVGIDSSGAAYYNLQHHGLMNAYTAGFDLSAQKLSGQPVRVTSRHEGLTAIPMWSPDGKQLAWIDLKSGYLHMQEASITVRDASTGKETTSVLALPTNRSMPQYMPSPAWMSDSRHVLVMAEDANHVLFLYKVDPSTGIGIDLTNELSSPRKDVLFSAAAWSPDGSTVYRVEGLNAIVMRQGNSKEWRSVVTDPAAAVVYEPAPSPDGSQVAYVAESDSTGRDARIKTVNLRNHEVRTVANAKPIRARREIIWTPSGQHLVYATSSSPVGPSQLWIVPATGGTPKRIATDFEGQIFDLAFSPDGRQIGFTQRTVRTELWSLGAAVK